MRQRVMIAMALACEPDILIADEPTTALDVTIQAQILELMQKLQKKLGMAIIMVTHDLGVIADMCDEIIVMYGGRVLRKRNGGRYFLPPSPRIYQRAFAFHSERGPDRGKTGPHPGYAHQSAEYAPRAARSAPAAKMR